MSNGRLKTATMGPAFIGVVFLFCAFAVVAWILFRTATPENSYEDKRAQGRREKAASIAREEQEKLHGGTKWIDKAKGTVQIPIDSAMELVINQYQTRPMQASTVKVENPYPAGLGGIPASATTGGTAAQPAAPATQALAVPTASAPAAAPGVTTSPATPMPAPVSGAASPAPTVPAVPATTST